jgi:hypothetical protein
MRIAHWWRDKATDGKQEKSLVVDKSLLPMDQFMKGNREVEQLCEFGEWEPFQWGFPFFF